MKFPEENTFKYKNFFKKFPHILEFNVMVNVDVTIKAKVLKIFIIKSHFFCYYIDFGLEHILPSGCHHYSGDDCKEWLVREMQELESKMYKCSNETNMELKMGKKCRN